MVVNKYGDVVLVAGGTYTSKPRPVLVFQSNITKTDDSVIIIPFTSVDNTDIQTRVKISPTAQNGLDRKCFLEVEKISAIKKANIGKSIGTLEHIHIDEALSIAIKLITNDAND
jgi:mRNA interferase MazF